jgi:hypothetical protein
LKEALKTTAPVAAGVVVLFAILVVVLVAAGVFHQGTSENDVTVVAGMLTLLGGLIASAFTLVGLLLKHSIDQRTARQADETEHRLRLETSIKAVELLTLPDGSPAPPSRQAGALFVLGAEPLEQLELALALLDENWRAGAIRPTAAVWVIDRALRSDDPNLQLSAATTLLRHADLLPKTDGSGVEWPTCIALVWPREVDYFARVALIETVFKVLATRKPADWDQRVINSFLALLDLVRRTDDAPEVHGGATLLLDVTLEWYGRKDPEGGILLPTGPVRFKELRADILPKLDRARSDSSQQMWTDVEQLRTDWGYVPPA